MPRYGREAPSHNTDVVHRAGTEYATTHPDRVRALLLFSGLPSLAQQSRVAAGLKRVPPARLTVGSQEKYFGGRDSFEQVAADFACSLVEFEGGHCREDEAIILSATRAALKGCLAEQSTAL